MNSESTKFLVFDTETTGLDITTSRLLGIGYTNNGEIKYSNNPNEFFSLMNTHDVLIGHNLKFDLAVIGYPEKTKIFDTMVAEWLLFPDQNKYGLKYLSEKYFGEKTVGYQELINLYKPKNKRGKECTLEVVPEDKVETYCKKDVEITKNLFVKVYEKLKENKRILHLFFNIEMPFLRVLLDMEKVGIKIDPLVIAEQNTGMSEKVKNLRLEVLFLADKSINLDSPKQVAMLLFDELKLPPIKKTKQGYSTDDSVLSLIADKHPIIPLLLEYRKLTKLQRTYLEALPIFIKADGRVHPNYNQIGTGTGRISCDSPNLQNIPAKGHFGAEIRKAFIPDKGNVFLIADYDQMELRMLAHMSKDKNMLDIYKAGKDIHQITADQLGITRDDAKTINFALIYGASSKRLANELKTTEMAVNKFKYKYACLYPEAWQWRKRQQAEVEKTLTTSTILGRKRDLANTKAFVPRVAVNTPIQGSCADLVKVAMIRLFKALKPYKAKIVLQIHDELIVEAPAEEVETLIPIIKGYMESVNIYEDIALICPMVVKVDVRKSWFKEVE